MASVEPAVTNCEETIDRTVKLTSCSHSGCARGSAPSRPLSVVSLPSSQRNPSNSARFVAFQ